MPQTTMTESFTPPRDEATDLAPESFDTADVSAERREFERRYHAIAPPDLTSEFDYKPVPILAPVSLFLGVASVIGLFGIVGVVVAFFGTILAAMCLLKIVRSGGELGGKWLAAAGLVLSFTLLVTGTAIHAYAYATEVPEGYTRINFNADIAKKPFQRDEDGNDTIHADVQALDGQKVFLKGFMYPELQTENLKRFVLVKDNQQCCFGGNPARTDMILVEMQGETTADYSTGLVSVAGTFRAVAPQRQGSLETVYELEATHFSRAKTSF